MCQNTNCSTHKHCILGNCRPGNLGIDKEMLKGLITSHLLNLSADIYIARVIIVCTHFVIAMVIESHLHVICSINCILQFWNKFFACSPTEMFHPLSQIVLKFSTL
jgi:hypothetical protein